MTKETEYWHGTTNGYSNKSCRCDACKAAGRDYQATLVPTKCDECDTPLMRPRSTVNNARCSRNPKTAKPLLRVLCKTCHKVYVDSTRIYTDQKHRARESKRRQRARRRARGLNCKGQVMTARGRACQEAAADRIKQPEVRWPS